MSYFNYLKYFIFINFITLSFSLPAYAAIWVGNIQSRPVTVNGVWTVGQRRFEVDNTSRLIFTFGNLEVGACVRVDYQTDFFGDNIVFSVESVNPINFPDCRQSQIPDNNQNSCIIINSANKLSVAYANGIQQVFAVDSRNELREFWRTLQSPRWRLENLYARVSSTPNNRLSGTSIVGAPMFQRGFYNGADTQQVFILQNTGDLREFWWTPRHGWRLENLSTQTRAPTLRGNFAFQRSDGLQQLFIADEAQQLREFWWTPERGWTIENISQITGGVLIQGAPVFYRSVSEQVLFATNSRGELLEFRWIPSTGWRVRLNVSVAVDAPRLVGNPILWRNAGLNEVFIFVRSVDNDLIVFTKSGAAQTWRMDNVSVLVGGVQMVGDPTAKVTDEYRQVFVRTTKQELVEFRRFVESRFNWFVNENISVSTGNVKIAGDPVYSEVENTAYLFARDSAGALLEFWRNAQSDAWQVENVNEVVCR